MLIHVRELRSASLPRPTKTPGARDEDLGGREVLKTVRVGGGLYYPCAKSNAHRMSESKALKGGIERVVLANHLGPAFVRVHQYPDMMQMSNTTAGRQSRGRRKEVRDNPSNLRRRLSRELSKQGNAV